MPAVSGTWLREEERPGDMRQRQKGEGRGGAEVAALKKTQDRIKWATIEQSTDVTRNALRHGDNDRRLNPSTAWMRSSAVVGIWSTRAKGHLFTGGQRSMTVSSSTTGATLVPKH